MPAMGGTLFSALKFRTDLPMRRGMRGARAIATLVVCSFALPAHAPCAGYCSRYTCDSAACDVCGSDRGCAGRPSTPFGARCMEVRPCLHAPQRATVCVLSRALLSQWCNMQTCEMEDCGECAIMTNHECYLPPPPPGKPPSPPTACTPADVAGQHFNCLEHGGCCEEGGYTCFRKHGSGRRGYARCMTECPERDDWACEAVTFPKPAPPPPPHEGLPCAADYTTCLEPQCCLGGNWGCYKRAGRHFAMCKPLSCNGGNCSCIDSDDWLCPGWELLPPPAPPPLLSPPSLRPPEASRAGAPLPRQAGSSPGSAPSESPALDGIVATAAVLAMLFAAGGVMWQYRRAQLHAEHGVELHDVPDSELPRRKRFAARLASEDVGPSDDSPKSPAERGRSEKAKLNAKAGELELD